MFSRHTSSSGYPLFGLLGDSRLKGCTSVCTPRVFEINGPNHDAILEVQTDKILMVAVPAAVDDFSAQGGLIRKRRDLRNLARLPLAIRNYACSMGAHVVRIRQLRAVSFLVVGRGQIHNHRDGETLLHYFAKAVRGLSGIFPAAVDVLGRWAGRPQPHSLLQLSA